MRILDWVGPLLLCEEEVRRVPADLSGVYLLHVFHPGDGYYQPIYVGKSCDVQTRLSQHLSSRSSSSPEIVALRSYFRLYFSAAPVFDSKERDGAESALIQVLRPRCNRQVPRVVAVYPNLPPMALRFNFEGE